MTDFSVTIGNMVMKNPVTTASGTFGFGEEFSSFIDLNRLGAITVKGITVMPRNGNALPRIAETSSGILNSIGLQNPGCEAFIRDKLPYLRELDSKVIVNISGESPEQYAELASKLDIDGVDAVEVNVSCPNVKKGGMTFGTDAVLLREVVKMVRRSTGKTVIVKLSPNVTSIEEMAVAAQDAGADALSLINTLTGMTIDIRSKKPVLANVIGGLSGPAVKPVAVRAVWQVYKAVDIPIIGMGGIVDWRDAAEFMLAGASAVAVGTANFIDPQTTVKIVDSLTDYLQMQGLDSFSQLTGLAHKI